mgnify:CR=1 FL=1
MNILLGLIQLLLMIYITIFEYQRKSPVVFLWATLLLMFGFTHLITAGISEYDYSSRIQMEASGFAILFMFFYLFLRYLKYLTNQKVRNEEILVLKQNHACLMDRFFLVILIISIFIRLYSYIKYAGGFLLTSWSLGREYSATLDYFNVNQIFGILFYLSSGILLYYLIQRNKLLGLLCAVLLTFQVLITRNRVEVLPLLVSFISLLILKHRKLKIKEVLIFSFMGFICIFLIYALRAFRYYGSIDNFINSFTFSSFYERTINLFRNEGGELGLRREFYYFLQNRNQFTNFGKGHTYFRMLLVFIPTKWSFGLKPPDFAISMGVAIGMESGGSTHPTLFGDCYANLGWWGVLLGAFWALFVGFFDSVILKQKLYINKVLLFSLYAVSFVIMGRGAVYNGFVPMAYGTVFLMIGYRIFLLLTAGGRFDGTTSSL